MSETDDADETFVFGDGYVRREQLRAEIEDIREAREALGEMVSIAEDACDGEIDSLGAYNEAMDDIAPDGQMLPEYLDDLLKQ